MPSIDTEQLLEPVSATDPAGANLEYEAAFLELERAAQGKPEQQMGGTIVPAEPPDYRRVFEQATDLLRRSKDLRVASELVRALIYRDGFAGASEGFGLVHGLLERFWPALHPQLDAEEGNDPTMRITALSGLCTFDVLSALRVAPLLRSRSFGPISLRDIAAAAGDPSAGSDGAKWDSSQIEAAFGEVELSALELQVQTLKEALRHLAGIETTFETNAGVSGPEFTPLTQLLRQATSAVEPRAQARRAAEHPEAAPENGAAPAGAPRAAAPMAGEIQSRDDVVRVLDKICAYYARHEPSSPVPLLLQRCKRLVTMSFVEIMKDVAPDSMSQVEVLAGKPGN